MSFNSMLIIPGFWMKANIFPKRYKNVNLICSAMDNAKMSKCPWNRKVTNVYTRNIGNKR